MDNFKEQKELEKRQAKAKQVSIVFPKSKENNFQDFVVIDELGNQKYDGKVIGLEPDKQDYCSCKSFENGNNSKAEGYYPDTHGFAFQCKHIIAAREAGHIQQEQVKLIGNAFGVKEVKETHDQIVKDYESHFEQNLVQKDLLL